MTHSYSNWWALHESSMALLFVMKLMIICVSEVMWHRMHQSPVHHCTPSRLSFLQLTHLGLRLIYVHTHKDKPSHSVCSTTGRYTRTHTITYIRVFYFLFFLNNSQIKVCVHVAFILSSRKVLTERWGTLQACLHIAFFVGRHSAGFIRELHLNK